MPTNLLRAQAEKAGAAQPAPAARAKLKPVEGRQVRLRAGRSEVTLALHLTQTAELIWRALPLYAVAETWGQTLHFDTPVRAGRDRTARLNASPGDVCFWSEDERIIVAWGPTPISRPNEVRLMRPCNVWASVTDDPTRLAVVTPGEKIVLEAI